MHLIGFRLGKYLAKNFYLLYVRLNERRCHFHAILISFTWTAVIYPPCIRQIFFAVVVGVGFFYFICLLLSFQRLFFLIWSSYRFVSISSFRPFCRYYTFLSLVSIKYYYNFISVCFSSMRVEFYVALNWSMRFNAKQKQWQKIKTCVTDSF